MEVITNEKLTTKEVALYLGCEVIVNPFEEFIFKSRLTGILGSDKVQLSDGSLKFVWEIKPILRPLSAMVPGDLFQLSVCDEEGLDLPSPDEYWKNCASMTMLLLSRGFDLFDWIPNGLAVDATKLNASK